MPRVGALRRLAGDGACTAGLPAGASAGPVACLPPCRRRGLAARCLPVLLALVLAGCTTLSGPVPVPRHRPPLASVQQFQLIPCDAGGQAQGPASLVVVQPQADGWRWLQLDGFGAPQARQVLDDSGWRNDGFLPPHPTARAVFAGLGLLLVPPPQRAALYPGIRAEVRGDTTNYLEGKTLRWQLRTQADGWWLGLADGSSWCVHPLS